METYVLTPYRHSFQSSHLMPASFRFWHCNTILFVPTPLLSFIPFRPTFIIKQAHFTQIRGSIFTVQDMWGILDVLFTDKEQEILLNYYIFDAFVLLLP